MTTASRKTNKLTPAQEFLKLVRSQIALIRKDLPRMIDMAQSMADALIKGGNIFVPDVHRYWRSEFGGRAGGLMIIKGKPDSAKDIAFFPLRTPGTWDPETDEEFQNILKAKAKIFIIGDHKELGKFASSPRITASTGAIDPKVGMYKYQEFSPFASLRPLDQFVRGWITTGEMITACIRAEKMPRIWTSVWHEASIVRNAALLSYNPEQSNYGEPFEYEKPISVFHKDRFIPYLEPGYAAEAFLKAPELFINTLFDQPQALTQIGQWMAEAKQNNKRVFATATGHSHPLVLEIPNNDSSYPIEWGNPISNLRKAIPGNLGPGDVALHLGYAPIHNKNIQDVLKQGIRLAHTTPYGPRKNMPQNKNFLLFNLPWRPADAWVDVPGYNARILPSSSTAHAIAYPAILCEFAHAMGYKK